jgi:hypothetical protein
MMAGMLKTHKRTKGREAQFLIEQPCPITGQPIPAIVREALPFAVWVRYPAEDPICHACTETPRVWRLTNASIRELRRRFDGTIAGRGLSNAACVCDHMGRLIE